jgi:hypothetical protein
MSQSEEDIVFEESPQKQKKRNEQEFAVGFKDVQRTAAGFGEQEDELDPRTKTIKLFRTALEQLHCLKEIRNETTQHSEYFINKLNYQEVKNHIKEFPQLLLLNMDLLAMAICYFSENSNINKEKITSFLDSTRITRFLKDHNHDFQDIDVMRYIKFYNNNKLNQ